MQIRKLTVRPVQEATALINKWCEIFCSNNPNCKWS
jgi:hypothetical protein